MKKILITEVPDSLKPSEKIFISYNNAETGYLMALKFTEFILPTDIEIEKAMTEIGSDWGARIDGAEWFKSLLK